MTMTAPQRLEAYSNGNPKPNQKAEVMAAHNRVKDSDPRQLSAADFNSIGHEKRPLLTIIRQNCLECMGGYEPGNHPEAEVRNCKATGCLFWPYRMGTTPFVSEARREAGRRLAALSRQRAPDVPG